MIGHELLRYNLQGKKFLVFDFENVEGLNLFYSRPHELGYLIYDGQNLVSEYFSYIKWPDYRPCKEAIPIVKYKQETIDEQGRDPKEVFESFGKLIYDEQYYIIGSNILNYDVMIFFNSMKRLGLKADYSFLNRCYDVNSLFKGYKLGRKVDNENLLTYQFSCNNWVQKGLKSNLAYMCKDFQIEFDDTKLHGGAYDAQKTFEIFLNLIKKIDVK